MICYEKENDAPIPNQSKHTIGINANPMPYGKPSIALAIHKFPILLMAMAESWEARSSEATSVSE